MSAQTVSAPRIISEKQLAANRRNAKKSTGPTTPEGKQTSRENGRTHGLTARVLILSPEEQACHDRFVHQYIACLEPETFIENNLAQSVAESMYRLHYASAIDRNIFALEHPSLNPGQSDPDADPEIEDALAGARTFLDHAKQFQLLTLYEQRIQRNMEKTLAELKALQAERKAAREQALLEAELILLASQAEGTTCDPTVDFPAANGFGFSIAEIEASIERKRRLKEGAALLSRGFAPETRLARAA